MRIELWGSKTGFVYKIPLVVLFAGVLFASSGAVLSQGATSSAGAPGKPLAFEIVSIREDKSDQVPGTVEKNGPSADGLHLKDARVFGLFQMAYRPSDGGMPFRPNRIIGVPEWAFYSNGIRYDIDAKVSETDLPRWRDPAEQPAMMRAMLQGMLADRFKAATHRETREIPIYELTVGRKSPKLKPSQGATLDEIRQKYPDAQLLSGSVIAASGPNPGQQMFFGVTMQELCALLENLAGRPIHDKTGLTGKYDVTYQIEVRPPSQENGAPAPVPPDFFNSQISSIVQDQLGLQIKATKGPVEVLVVDHVERPSEN